jgi:hypothetical protein
MTPHEYLRHLDELLAAGEHEAVLNLAERCGSEIHPQLSDHEFFGVTGVLHVCAMAVSMAEADRARDAAERSA